MLALSIILYLITIIVWSYILTYLLKLEKTGCECSKGWQRTFITYFVVYLIIMLLFKLFNLNLKKMSITLAIVHFVVMIIFFVIVFQYVHRLKREKCQCSEDNARDVLEIINYIQIALEVIKFIALLYLIIIIHKFVKKLKPKIK